MPHVFFQGQVKGPVGCQETCIHDFAVIDAYHGPVVQTALVDIIVALKPAAGVCPCKRKAEVLCRHGDSRFFAKLAAGGCRGVLAIADIAAGKDVSVAVGVPDQQYPVIVPYRDLRALGADPELSQAESPCRLGHTKLYEVQCVDDSMQQDVESALQDQDAA